MMAAEGQGELPAFQLEVARLFFTLPASSGFLLAEGAALLVQHLPRLICERSSRRGDRS